MAGMVKMGRPTLYNNEIANSIISELATTKKGFEVICVEHGLSHTTGWDWLNANVDFLEKYVRARELQTELGFDEMESISSAPLTHNGKSEEEGGKPLDAGMAMAEMQRRKLVVDVLKFKLAKLQRKRFGDNQNVDVNVKMQRTLSPDQFKQLLQVAIEPPKAEEIEFEEE